VLASPAAADRHARHVAERMDGIFDCLRLAARDDVLRPGALTPESKWRVLGGVRLTRARSFSDAELWDLVGGAPSLPLSGEEATALAVRLSRSGLFSAVEPRLHTTAGEEFAEMEIALTENPTVRSVQVRGLSEFRTEDILDRLLETPSDREIERRRSELRDARTDECPAPLPPRKWLAHLQEGEVRPGLLGLRPALVRVLRLLSARGYPLARLSGELGPAGDLVLEVDEGRVSGVEVRGVDGHIAREVEMELGIRRGDIFSSAELFKGLERVQRRWPFLRPDRRSRRSPVAPSVRLDPRLDGSVEFRSEAPAEARRPPAEDDDDFHIYDLSDEAELRGKRDRQKVPGYQLVWKDAWYGFEGDTLIVELRSERSRASAQWTELLRHTPVTGFAPGLAGTLTIYDPADRAHLMFDGALNFNTRRHSHDATGGTFLEKLNAQEHVDWLLGMRLRIPGLALAELGGQVHTLTDTPDRWRMSRIDSYLYSAVLNRADREYYRRSGYTAILTAHLFEELTLGAEYRRDRYAPLDVPNGVWSVFNSGEVKYGSAPVDEGEMGSAVFRLEYRSEKVPLHRVGSMWRNPETSVVETEPWTIGLRSVNTFEVADRSLGGIFDFTKLVTDTSLTMETGRDSTLTLRMRGAGGRNLPVQKEEALGGWSALRGYGFKEFRGNASLLGTLQLQGSHFGAFLDVGSVRQSDAGWMDPKSSAGALFCVAKKTTCAEAAWRLDGKAKPAPEFRVLFSVPL
jgi:hypothetical protein